MKKTDKKDSYEQMRERKEREAIRGRNLCIIFAVVSVFMAIAVGFERSNRTTHTQGVVIKKFSEEVKHFNPTFYLRLRIPVQEYNLYFSK